MKCDLHVHSYFSGPCTTPFVGRFCRESYSDPEQVYSLLGRRGMNLFTLTDHDSIEGSEKLRRHPDFFLSEELTCRMPSGTEVHIGVYDFHERQHAQLQQRRNDLVALLMYLTERRLFFSINHIFSSVTGRREREDFAWFQEYFPAIETHNSHMLESTNGHAAALARQWDKIAIGGSDAHALASVGTAFTEVPGARDKEEFFAGLKAGMGRVGGESGSFSRLTRDVFLIAFEMMREKSWTTLLTPLAVLVPAVTYLNYRADNSFGRLWAAQVLHQPESRKRSRWIAVPRPAAEEWV
ncbi:MAG TPA: PHP domain-containing protein [Candidatus Acidoferrales bacterium]|nr:PHP domain-containing protein [Candidatus Acidoferrales bacterium]